MILSARETALAIAAMAVVLFGVSGLLLQKPLREWTELGRQRTDLLRRVTRARDLNDQRDAWSAKLDDLSRLLSRHGPDERIDVHWLSEMDKAARRAGVTISKRQVGDEKQNGQVYELPIEVKEWESSLESLVRFLFELETQGAMFDVRQLAIKPKGPDALKGRFVLHCAYTRAQPPAGP